MVMVGPDDDRPRPTVILFHGCGGLRDHLPRYAQAARAVGWRACIVDSYPHRGLTPWMAMGLVCTGLMLHGAERAGDVLAAIDGVSRRPDVDGSRLALAGWSHGGWSILEAMSLDPDRFGAAGLRDAGACDLTGVKAVWLAYAYVGFANLNRMRPWRHCPRVVAVTASRDHLTTVRNAEQVNAMIRGCGAEVDSWIVDGTHSFDEPTSLGPMQHDEALTEQALARFGDLLTAVA